MGIALYAVTLGGTWVYDDIWHLFMDDRTQVAEEAAPGARPAIEDPRQWGRYLTQSYNDGIDNLYRPITSLSFAMQATLHGRSERVAWLWHLVNVLLYGAVCAQVALLAGRLAQADQPAATDGAATRAAAWAALAAGILFAVHPVHVEVVAGLVGRAELICALGFFGGLLVLTRPLTPWRIAAFVLLMLLSIGGKEQGLVLPAVALVWYVSRRWAGLPSLTRPHPVEIRAAEPLEAADSLSPVSYQPRRPKSDGLGKVLIAAVALPLAAYLILREQVLELSMAWPVSLLDPSIQTMRDTAGLDRWLMPVAIAGRYLHLLVWPSRLAIDYGAVVISPPQEMSDPYLWLGFLAIALLATAVIHALRRRWAAGLTVLAGFAFTYGVVSNIPALIGTVFGERLLFLPSGFFVMYVVLLAQRLTGGPRGSPAPARLRSGLIAIAGILALLGGVRSFTYAHQWNDRVEFYYYQSRVQPASLRIWMLLADELRQRGRLDEAAAAAERATELDPDYWSHWMLRAKVAMERGRLEEALEYAEQAVRARTAVNTTILRAQIEEMIHQRDRERQDVQGQGAG